MAALHALHRLGLTVELDFRQARAAGHDVLPLSPHWRRRWGSNPRPFQAVAFKAISSTDRSSSWWRNVGDSNSRRFSSRRRFRGAVLVLPGTFHVSDCLAERTGFEPAVPGGTTGFQPAAMATRRPFLGGGCRDRTCGDFRHYGLASRCLATRPILHSAVAWVGMELLGGDPFGGSCEIRTHSARRQRGYSPSRLSISGADPSSCLAGLVRSASREQAPCPPGGISR